MGNQSKWTSWHTVALWVLMAGILLIGWKLTPISGLWAWIVILVLMGLVFIIIGLGVTGSASGLLIDNRNKMSLSRFQMTLWTLVVLSGYLAAALVNIFKGSPDPLAIALQPELWTLMGISTASLVGSPLIKSTKETKQPQDDEKTGTFKLLTAQTGIKDFRTKGLIVVNPKPEDASWSNMFGGEETGNAAYLDLAKVQMFFFTIILVLTYAVTLGKMFYQMPAVINDLPNLSSGMTALLGISHAGYLTNKGIPHSGTQ